MWTVRSYMTCIMFHHWKKSFITDEKESNHKPEVQLISDSSLFTDTGEAPVDQETKMIKTILGFCRKLNLFFEIASNQ